MSTVTAIARRELGSYFSTPLAYVFLVIFLVLAGLLTFYAGDFYDRNLADLQPFFAMHPWLYLVLVPAVAMPLWAEETRSGTIELLMTMPVSTTQAMLGKFLAAWGFVAIALLLTFPIWITVNYLGVPDNGVILASYLGSWLMAGAFLAIGICMSAATSSQIIAFLLTASVCFLLLLAGQSQVLDFFQDAVSPRLLGALSYMSILRHSEAIARGVLDFRDVIYFVATILAWLTAGVILLDYRRAR